MFLDGTEKSLKAALGLLFQFSKYSGLKPNFGKTKAIWIGSKSGSSEFLCPNFKIQWTNEDFNVLGIKFNSSLTNITEINFEPKLASIIKEINNWNKRQLTPLGKITVIKSLLLPKLTHLFITLPTPSKQWITQLEKLFFSIYLEWGK